MRLRSKQESSVCACHASLGFTGSLALLHFPPRVVRCPSWLRSVASILSLTSFSKASSKAITMPRSRCTRRCTSGIPPLPCPQRPFRISLLVYKYSSKELIKIVADRREEPNEWVENGFSGFPTKPREPCLRHSVVAAFFVLVSFYSSNQIS